MVEREHERTLGWEKGDSRTKEGGGHEVWESKEERRRRELFLKRNLGLFEAIFIDRKWRRRVKPVEREEREREENIKKRPS